MSGAYRPSSGAVDSVNAQIGVVVLDTDNIGEGALNLYYTVARVANDSPVKSIQGLTGVVVLDTDDITEGTNLYFTNLRATDAMGMKLDNNPLNHDRYRDVDAVTAMGVLGDANTLNHDRYVDGEAVTAMGVLGDANPLNHDKYTDGESQAAAGWVKSAGQTALQTIGDSVGIGVAIPTVKLDILGASKLESSGAAIVPLTIKEAAGQTANIQQWTDSADSVVARVTRGGKIQSERGFRGVANEWGDSLSGWAFGEFVAEHSGITASYDYTGGTYERLLTATIGVFTQSDADNKNWIVLNSGDRQGAKAQIDEYISVTQVTLHSNCWDEDLAAQTFSIYKAPSFIAGDCHDTHLTCSGDGHFHVENSGGDYTGPILVEITNKAGADRADGFHIHHDANGYNNSDAMQIFYDTGDLQDGDESQALQISIDESQSTAGHMDGILIEGTNTQINTIKHAIHIGVGFDSAIIVSGASAIDPAQGYEVTTGAVADRVNGVAPDGTAFLSGSASDLTILENNSDYILIGSAAQFEVIEVVLDTPSSKNLELEFFYSKTGLGFAGWTQFNPDDGTAGFTKSGLISFTSPAGLWTQDDEAEVDGDITNAYYIGIKRTRVGDPPTLPIESYFKTYVEQTGDTGMEIKGDGRIKLPYLAGAPANLENGDMWMEADGLHIYYGGAEKLVAGV